MANATPQSTNEIMVKLTQHNAPRALLVSIKRDGSLEHVPVVDGKSLLNIETELHDHLSAQPRSDAFLMALRDYCNGRLAARAEARATGGFCIPVKSGWNILHTAAFQNIEDEPKKLVH